MVVRGVTMCKGCWVASCVTGPGLGTWGVIYIRCHLHQSWNENYNVGLELFKDFQLSVAGKGLQR